MKLIDKVVLVTGAGSGLGRASALAFAEEGAKVVAADIDQKAGEEASSLINERGGQAIFVKTDITNEASVKALIDTVIQTYGKLDCAHNNAGIMIGGPIIDIDEKDWDKLMSINLKGTWLCMKHELIHMLTNQEGVIINTASAAGLSASPNTALYGTSKWGVNGLTKSAAIEYARQGIRVNSICPAGMKGTKMWLDTFEQDPALSAQLTESVPMGRDTSPEEVAKVVVWLCTDNASFITGVNMPVDGGMSSL